MAYLRGVEPGRPFILDARTFRTTPVMTLEALIASKKAVRRKQDIEQLIKLEAILALRTRGRRDRR